MPEIINKVHFLKSLKVFKDENESLFVLSVRGQSKEERVGVPLLRMKKLAENTIFNGILEFEFLIKSVDIIKKKNIEFQLDVVINRELLPFHIRGIKIIAKNNADILLI